jgi:hypothetical protein
VRTPRAPGLVVLLALAAPAAGLAQVAAPEIIDEELAPAEPAAAPARPPAPPPPAPEAPASEARALPGPAAPRPLEPVRARWDDLRVAWAGWREALRDGDLPRAGAAQERLLSLAAELGADDLFELAAAEARAADRAREARAPAEALLRASLAVALAPDLAAAHFARARARARLAGEPRDVEGALADLGAGLAAAAREPRQARSLGAQLAAAALAGVLLTAAGALLLLFLRRARLALHDARHVVPGATPAQAVLLALALLALPVALRLGPAAALATLALAAAPWLERAERALASAALCAVALAPAAAEEAARLAAFAGTPAEDVYLLERGDDGGRRAARLEARAAEAPPAALLALGRHRKRRGDLDGALRAYEAALPARADAAVNAANVRFLRGDLDGARAGYLAAVDRAREPATLAAAHYGLSKVYLRQSALDQAQEARRRALAADAALVMRAGSEQDFRANRWLVDVPLPEAEVAQLARDEAPAAVGAALAARLGGSLPAGAWRLALLAVAALLWPAALAARRLAPSHACPRCGRAACPRCDRGAAELCSQCVNVFVRRGVVDPRDRAAKERQVRRHARWARASERLLALACAGAGHLWRGEPWRGAAALLAVTSLAAVAAQGSGLLAPPHAPPELGAVLAGAAVALAALVWALSARDVFRRRGA